MRGSHRTSAGVELTAGELGEIEEAGSKIIGDRYPEALERLTWR